MCFQLANSVSQIAFGHLADRWRPRVLLLAGPILSVTVLPLIGLAPNASVLAVVLVLGGLGGAAFHPPAAALVDQHLRPDNRTNQRGDRFVVDDGIRVGVGGLAVPFVGMLADNIGIDHTLMLMSAVPLVAAELAVPLPSARAVPPTIVTP
jgi:MFS family permease